MAPRSQRAINGPILGGLLPVARSGRHQVVLGWSAQTSEKAVIAERGVNVLIQGDPLSGKSWLAGVLIELMPHGGAAMSHRGSQSPGTPSTASA
jgi:hypothetical protein